MQRAADGSLIGEKGVKYGLQKPAGLQARRPGPPAAAPRPNIFGDDDSDEDIEAQVARQADRKRSAAKVQQIYEQALAEDPSVFDYDGVYDSIQAARTQPKQQEKIERRSRYIAQLKEQADARKREEDIRFERRQLKERQTEDHLYEGKDKFITGAYRKKLEEDKKWQEAERLREEEEAKNDVRKIGHMGNFYANLLTKNVAMGTAASAKPSSASPEPEAPAAGGEGSEEAGTDAAAAKAAAAKAAAAKAGQPLDKYDLMRMEAERVRREKEREEKDGAGAGEAGAQAAGGAEDRQQQAGSSAAAEGTTAATAAAAGGGGGEQTSGAEAAAAAGGQDAAPAAPAAQAAPQAGKRRNDDDSVMSARERYLARKKQATGQ